MDLRSKTCSVQRGSTTFQTRSITTHFTPPNHVVTQMTTATNFADLGQWQAKFITNGK